MPCGRPASVISSLLLNRSRLGLGFSRNITVIKMYGLPQKNVLFPKLQTLCLQDSGDVGLPPRVATQRPSSFTPAECHSLAQCSIEWDFFGEITRHVMRFAQRQLRVLSIHYICRRRTISSTTLSWTGIIWYMGRRLTDIFLVISSDNRFHTSWMRVVENSERYEIFMNVYYGGKLRGTCAVSSASRWIENLKNSVSDGVTSDKVH